MLCIHWNIYNFFVYIDMIKDYMSNDLFWSNKSDTGTQIYLIEQLVRTPNMNLDLFDPTNAIIGNVHDAIVGFRSFDTSYTFSLFTQYCWTLIDVDLLLIHLNDKCDVMNDIEPMEQCLWKV
ncbi:hypothetical protein THRCLA_21222 [Thraustotheca clavata]|uniref:Uncharacterized protein n=1 Tax=Thraustotheca clavata TaxID=74557 RepID=A0A1V9ZYT2_9STRA|nr:hypothetical protein THRCLA_21222 [Thraustotheca clavata]